MIFGPVIIGFCRPACQLAALVVTWAYLILTRQYQRSACIRHLGKIGRYAFLGTIAGIFGTWLTFAFL